MPDRCNDDIDARRHVKNELLVGHTDVATDMIKAQTADVAKRVVHFGATHIEAVARYGQTELSDVATGTARRGSLSAPNPCSR